MASSQNLGSILIVDDDQDLREVIVEFFKESGELHVASEAGGRLAFERLRRETFQVVLTDIRMPDGDGTELIKKIHDSDLHPKPLIYVCSGYSDLKNEDCVRYNIRQIFSKPCDFGAVVSQIIETLKSKR